VPLGAVESETEAEHVDVIRRVVVKESQLSIMTRSTNNDSIC